LAYGFSSPSSNTDDSDDVANSLDDITILVCRTCRLQSDPDLEPRPGSTLAENTMAAGTEAGVRVQSVQCLANCKRSLSAAILRRGEWSYVFGDLTPDNAADLIDGAKLFATSTNGLMPFRGRPEALKRGLISRVPTFENLKDLP
jgi:predicted metal-binding protein